MRYIFRPHLLNTLVTLVLLSALVSLGFWQLDRAEKKTLIQIEFQSRQHQMIDLKKLNLPTQDLRFFKLKISGKFDNAHFILLDNKIVKHQVGYELYVPFSIFGSHKIMLIDRGFIPQGSSRQQLPEIDPILGRQDIQGTLNTIPSSGLDIGAEEKLNQQFPIRVSKINLAQLGLLLHQDFYTYILVENNNALHIMSMKPERHVAYAVQWFMLAGTLFILYLVVSIKKSDKED